MKNSTQINMRKGKRLSGCSTKECIMFFSKESIGIYSGAKLVDGEIKRTKRIGMDFVKDTMNSNRVLNISFVILWVLEILYLIILNATNFKINTMMLMVTSLLVYVRQKDFINSCVYQKMNLCNFEQLARNHAAEHQIANAYETLGRVPKNIEEIKKFSVIHERCGDIEHYVMFFMYMIPSIIYAFLYSKSLYITIILQIVAIAIIMFLHIKYNFFKYFEILFLKKPTDKELKLALEALENHEEFVSFLKNKICEYENSKHYN